MKEIIKIEKDMTVSSRVIAEGCGIQHKNALELLEKHKAKMESKLGRVTFKTETLNTNGGKQKTNIAYLTEAQATALITMMQNTDRVVDFKIALADAFVRLKSQKLPTYGDLARMVLEYENKMGIAGDMFYEMLPKTEYGSIAPNGQPRNFFRSSAWVAAKRGNMQRAAKLFAQAAQLELNLALEDA
jgi:hypothetical protein